MRSVMTSQFGQAPGPDLPRSTFNMNHGHKTTIDAGYLVPITWFEILPGDTVSVNPSVFARMSTPVYPLMDNAMMDIHFFFVPYRQLWTNFFKFQGEQDDPGDSIDYTLPRLTVPVGGFSENSLYDYLGIPPGVDSFNMNAFTLRAYNHIYNEWYRDQNLIDSVAKNRGDGPDTDTDYTLLKRGKRHDYFTSCLTSPQKGDPVSMPLGTSADIYTDAGTSTDVAVYSTSTTAFKALSTDGTAGGHVQEDLSSVVEGNKLYADLTGATAATINQLRLAFATQKILEKDARSGTRYSEIVKSHFGVTYHDLSHRPEFLGGSTTPVVQNSVPNTSEISRPTGDLGAFAVAGTTTGGFTKSFTEHGLIMGIISVRADLTYQQGLHKSWSKQTRYDMYLPSFAHIGEQTVLNQEIYLQGTSADTDVFGYQEAWAEYRYQPSRISGLMRSAATLDLDEWHLSQNFASLPTLSQTFIEEDPPFDRVISVASQPHFIVDTYFECQMARVMPLRSTPGLVDHF